MLQEIKKWVTESLLTGNAVTAFFSIWQGRCTFAAIIFSSIGCYGWLKLGRDLTSFALFVTAAQGLLVLHSWKSDIHEQRTARLEIDRARQGIVTDLSQQNPPANSPAAS